MERHSPSPVVAHSSNRHIRHLFDDKEPRPLEEQISRSTPIWPPSRHPIGPADESRMDDILKELCEAKIRLKDVTNHLDNVEG